MKRSKRDLQKSRESIIELAAPVFNKYGYAGTRMDMVVAATGYQKGGIYQHFESKMELAKAAFQYNFQKLFGGYLENIAEDLSPKEKLMAFIRNYQYFVRNAPVDGGCPILNTATESDDVYEELRKIAAEALDRWHRPLATIISEGQKQGAFKSELEAEEIAAFIIATIEGAIMIGKLKLDARLMLRIGEQLIDYLEKVLFR